MNLSEFKTLEELAAALMPVMRSRYNHVFGDGTGASQIIANGAAGNARDFIMSTDGVARWVLRTNADTESGSNAGSNFDMISRQDDGSILATMFQLERANNYFKIGSATDLFTSGSQWQDYSGSSTVGGWSSFAEKVIEFKRIGKIGFVNFRIAGTSNTNQATFTVPFSEGQTGNPIFFCRSTDNSGAAVASYGQFTSSTLVALYPAPNAAVTGWTASGTKAVYGQFFYQTT